MQEQDGARCQPTTHQPSGLLSCLHPLGVALCRGAAPSWPLRASCLRSRQLKALAGPNGVEQPLAQDFSGFIVGQFEQVEAGGGGRQPMGLVAAHAEEGEHGWGVAAVARDALHHEGRLQVTEAEQRRPGAGGDKLEEEGLVGVVELGQHPPQVAHGRRQLVVPARVPSVPPEIGHVDGRVVAVDQPLQLLWVRPWGDERRMGCASKIRQTQRAPPPPSRPCL
eukprot:scaffold27944_cov112-Isochrysis_galbana.AAC.3